VKTEIGISAKQKPDFMRLFIGRDIVFPKTLNAEDGSVLQKGCVTVNADKERDG
jgi:hypothetical protein